MILTYVTLSPEGKLDVTGLAAEKVDALWKIFLSVYLESTDPQYMELTLKKSGIFSVLKAATTFAFSLRANNEYVIKYVTAMVREKLLSDVDGCIQLLKM